MIKLDRSKMPSIEELYLDNPVDYKGKKVLGTQIVKGEFHRGHVIPKSKAGKNTNLKLQEVKSNLSYSDTPL